MPVALGMAVFLLLGGAMERSNEGWPLREVLATDGPRPDIPDQALYGQFVGHWEVDVFDYASDGSRRAAHGEWHFAWVLEGRAIQDVFVVPTRAERPQGEQPTRGNRYGTTLRVYDPALRAWRITWINPVSGALNTLVARCQDGTIVQEGRDQDGELMRWSFSEITPDSFRWRGEASRDDGRTWRLAAEFFARRVRGR
jgi:hypothetical protein